jgi:hypothetical protein
MLCNMPMSENRSAGQRSRWLKMTPEERQRLIAKTVEGSAKTRAWNDAWKPFPPRKRTRPYAPRRKKPECPYCYSTDINVNHISECHCCGHKWE